MILLIDTVIKLVSTGSIGMTFESLCPGSPHFQLAMFHTIFNIASVLIALPFTGLFVSLSKKIIPGGDRDQELERFYFVDENMLKTPAIAVSQVKKEIMTNVKQAKKNRHKVAA